MYDSVLSIDLGASYSKVSVRAKCEPKGRRPSKQRALLYTPIEATSPLIPSLAIKTNRPDKPWLFGGDAAGIKPSGEMTIFSNWKAQLFKSESDSEFAGSAVVAYHFFVWLKEQLKAAKIDPNEYVTSLALPKLENLQEKAALFQQCMQLAGWPHPISSVTEPYANTLGLLSEGRNVINKDSNGDFHPDFGKMFRGETPWIGEARNFALNQKGTGQVRILIVDLGAFTTDVASLEFNVTAYGDGLTDIAQSSYELGVIADLDAPLFKELANIHEIDLQRLRFTEQELMKERIYAGNTYAVPKQTGNTVTFGASDDFNTINSHLLKFSNRVFDIVATHLPAEKCWVYLTGGGSMIPKVASELSRELIKRNHGCYRDQGRPTTPRSKSEILLRWEDTQHGLHRVATALGGASVIVQSRRAKAPDFTNYNPAIPLPVRAENPEFRACYCQGGNKECCFCGGRGYYDATNGLGS